MTVPYNVTTLGISEKLEEVFDKYYLEHAELLNLEKGLISLEETLNNLKADTSKKDKLENKEENEKGGYILVPSPVIKKTDTPLYFTSSELFKFARILQITVLNTIPPFVKLKKYFDGIITIIGGLDLPFFWQTPAGLKVSMSSIIMKSQRLKQNLIKKSKPISILIPTDVIDYKKIKIGLMPNFIHSLDASNIHVLICNILKLKLENINLYTIHDCFASDYNNIAIIELLVKHSFIELYFKKDYLLELHDSFVKQIRGYTDIYEEDSEEGKLCFVLLSSTNKKGKIISKKVYLPKLPAFEWDIDETKLKEEILYNTYFIS